MKKHTKTRGHIELLKDCFPKRKIKTEIDEYKLKEVFETVFLQLNNRSVFSGRFLQALKLYYHLEPNDKGEYCSTYKETGESIRNLYRKYNTGNGVSFTRAGQLIKKGRRFLCNPSRLVYFEEFFEL